MKDYTAILPCKVSEEFGYSFRCEGDKAAFRFCKNKFTANVHFIINHDEKKFIINDKKVLFDNECCTIIESNNKWFRLDKSNLSFMQTKCFFEGDVLIKKP